MIVAWGITQLLTSCAGYNCDEADRSLDNQERLVVPLVVDLLSSVSSINDCDSGGGGYTVAEGKEGATIEQVIERLTSRGWTVKKSRRQGAVSVVGTVGNTTFEVLLDKRPESNPVFELQILPAP